MNKVLVFIDWYIPAFKAGGPVKSVSGLVNSLSSNISFKIITSDRDFGDSSPYANIKLNTEIPINETGSVEYLSPENRIKSIINIIQNDRSDFMYLNSLYSIHFSFIPLLIGLLNKKKVILAPRGMLGKGALELKPLKKKLFIAFYRALNLDKKVIWHVTSDQEKNEVLHVFERANIHIIPNISSDSSNTIVEIPKNQSEINLCFVSRISPKKNLKWALETLLMYTKEFPNGKIRFDIYGPKEDQSYWEECELFIQNFKSTQVSIEYKRELNADEVGSIISCYHFLFLPTKNENYGHVIAESFSVGRPVLISDQTPWRNLKNIKAGLDFSLEEKQYFCNQLKEFVEMNQSEYNEWMNSSQKYYQGKQNREEIISQYKNLFQ